jgi:formylglycine-generating enzyme required for sulfatase activity
MPATPSVTAPHFSRPNAPTQEPAAPTKSRGTLWFMVALWSFILLVVGGVALFVMLWNGEGEKGTKKNAPISALTAAEAKTLQESTARKLNADVDWENSIGMRFRLIPPGEFMMGSPPGEIGREANEMQYRVKIPQAFYLGTYTVTRGQFRVFVGETGYRTFAERSKMGGYIWREDQQKWERKPEYTWQNPDLAATDGFPVVIVTWSDAQEFCNWLSRKEGRTYRLPTEAEWEYACRAGTTTRYHSGDEDGSLADYAWTAANSGVQLHSVGKKRPNAWGLFDMHGNVWQWCQNRFDEDYSRNNPAVDLSQERIDTRRVVRGGSWLWVPSHCRSAHRYGIVSGIHDTHTGFRVYCEISRR